MHVYPQVLGLKLVAKMGSIGDDDDETQPYVTHPSPLPGDDVKEEDFDHLFQGTWPFGETVPAVDDLETQVMNFDGETQVLFDEGLETQVMNFEGETQVRFDDRLETQVMNFSGETQVLDDFVGFDNMDTQLLDEWNNEERDKTDGEESNKTEVLCDTNELSDNDSVKVANCSAGCENTSISKQDDEANKAESDALFYEQTSAGVKMNFTSVRAAALRASGLAARSKAMNKSSSDFCSSKVEDEALKDHATENINATSSRESPAHTLEIEHQKGTRDESKVKIEISAARRLFMDDENEGLENNKLNDADDMDSLQGNDIAGLSYVDSQEPGDLSQANALDFVDKFLKLSDTDIDKRIGILGSTSKKLKPDSIIKGTQSLAKKSRLKSASGEADIYSWDGNREDEGGGEFFSKNKKVFFDDDEKDLSRSCSANKAQTSKTKKAEVADVKKNLAKELEEQLEGDTLKGNKATCSGKDLQDMLNVGPDTQIAAEAMEELCVGLAVTEKGADKISKTTSKSSYIVAKVDKVYPTKYTLRKRANSSSCEDLTKKSKQRKKSGTNLCKKSTIPPTNKKVNTSKRTAKKAKVADVKKNVTKELDEQLNDATLEGNKATCSEKDLQDVSNVGPDTQLAVEAMEELCLGLEVTGKISENTSKSSSIVEREDKILPKEYSLRKRSSSSSCEDLTKNLKQRKKSGPSLSKDSTVSPMNKTARAQRNDLDKSVISPSYGQAKVPTHTPVASRTRRHCVTREWIVGNITCDSSTGTLSYKKGKRSSRQLSGNGHESVSQISGPETKVIAREVSNGSNSNPQKFSVDNGLPRKTRSSLHASTALHSSDRELEKVLCNQIGVKEKLEEGTLKGELRDGIKVHKENLNYDVSPGQRIKLSVSTSATPSSCTSSAAAASPICMGDEYLKQSCRKNLSSPFLVKEINSLISNGPEPSSMMKESRKRRDISCVRVLFSHHLDDDIINHQKKILAKLGASVAPSIQEATHFVTDKFVRTRNMLEAIAFGKPVVTHLWLESCGEASSYIDERNYILRDAKKEKEFGFSLPASLAHACQRPLLQGLKVWITPNTKPGVEILSSLVKAVHGLPVERIGRSVLNDEKIPDDLLALSCEEDYATCLPFLEKGGNVFSSELLLNGIVTQKLEYERHRLFDDHVKKTRSTKWLKRGNNQYLPIAKCK